MIIFTIERTKGKKNFLLCKSVPVGGNYQSFFKVTKETFPTYEEAKNAYFKWSAEEKKNTYTLIDKT